jgi:hypothetical protein
LRSRPGCSSSSPRRTPNILGRSACRTCTDRRATRAPGRAVVMALRSPATVAAGDRGAEGCQYGKRAVYRVNSEAMVVARGRLAQGCRHVPPPALR